MLVFLALLVAFSAASLPPIRAAAKAEQISKRSRDTTLDRCQLRADAAAERAEWMSKSYSAAAAAEDGEGIGAMFASAIERGRKRRSCYRRSQPR